MAHMLVAAAVPLNSVVRLPDGSSMTIDHIENSTPVPGKITWHDDDGMELEIGGAQEIEIEFLPKPKDVKV